MHTGTYYGNITGGGVDYVSGPFSVTIPAGQINVSFDVPITDDNIYEENESFRLAIVQSSTLDCVQVGRPRRATVVIGDDSDCKCKYICTYSSICSYQENSLNF